MAGTNDFKAIATGAGANVIDQAAFEALTTFLANGYSSGVVDSNQFNKVVRQSSFVSAVIGQLVANANINALDDGDIPGFVSDLVAALQIASPPPGTIIFVAQNTSPTGFLKANGAAISRASYSSLFSAIGTTYGVGDGSTTFNIPDLRGEFLRGWDDAKGVDSGRVIGTAQAGMIESHSHAGTLSPASQTGASGTAVYVATGNTVTGSYGGTETRPRNVALLACIKY